jgi:hypothetical protein
VTGGDIVERYEAGEASADLSIEFAARCG